MIPHSCIDIYVRYETHHQRQFDKALALLLKLRAETCKAEIGFVSQKQNEAQETRTQPQDHIMRDSTTISNQVPLKCLERAA